MDNQKPLALINLILSKLEELSWSQRQLSRASGVSSGAINNLLRGESVPETATVEKIADALGIPRRKILESLAGAEIFSEAVIDPTAMYIAKRLSELPQPIRERAIDAVSGVVDGFSYLVQDDASREDGETVDLTVFPEADRDLISQLAPVYQRYLAARLQLGFEYYKETMDFAKAEADAKMRQRDGQQVRGRS